MIHFGIECDDSDADVALVIQNGASYWRRPAQMRQKGRMHIECTVHGNVEQSLWQNFAVRRDDKYIPLLLSQFGDEVVSDFRWLKKRNVALFCPQGNWWRCQDFATSDGRIGTRYDERRDETCVFQFTKHGDRKSRCAEKGEFKFARVLKCLLHRCARLLPCRECLQGDRSRAGKSVRGIRLRCVPREHRARRML